MKRGHLTPGQLLAILAVIFFVATAGLLSVVSFQADRLAQKDELVRDLSKEIRWHRYVADRAVKRIPEYHELQFMAQALMTNDPNVYNAASAAWKWGKVYQLSPHLLMAIYHRESNFDPRAVSYINGVPCAYGLAQVNLKVWKDELAIDESRIFDPDYNAQLGAIILKRYMTEAAGDIGHALWLYWGRGASYTYSPMVLGSKYYEAPAYSAPEGAIR